MQRVIRRTALARNQSQRKAIRAAKAAERQDLHDALKQRFNYDRIEIDNVRTERERRREDWMRGPLAPRRDSGPEGKTFGSLSPHAMQPPKVAKHLRRKFINVAPGDRVCVIKGREKGKINVVTRVDAESETVMVKDTNMADLRLPEFMLSQFGHNNGFQAMNLPIPMDDVRLVVALNDPATGVTRDVLVEHVHAGKPFYVRPYGTDTPRHTRWIAGENVEIPWPQPEDPGLKDHEWDTLRMEVETPSWVPSLLESPFPPTVLDELRNKFSKYRTRHDPEWVEQKKLEDYRREWLQSRSLWTPKGELIAMARAKGEERSKAQRDASGNMIMDGKTAGFIEQFMKEKMANKPN